MDKHYQQNQQQPGMYQASDGKWYPVSAMPQGHQQGGFYGQYGQQQPMAPGPQPVYIQQQGSNKGGAGAGCCACCAGVCAAMTGLCCLDLCLFC
ncbi:hypothetical protein I302_101396 [Kwoniella bestiolae CBS 10118]|uniref:Cysteine-rich transmembrane CYSTM domain-containing protein n=1 Tax=Kwoniella bestiolae CBS 10118 TaxID=1296100 RepID=A0AAJ8K2A4_9TREE